MTFAAQPTSRRPAGRGFVLLVLVLLAGVLGMHALPPSPAAARTAAAAQAAHSAHAMAAARTAAPPVSASVPASAVDQDRGCSHTDGGSGHPGHADAICAAAGIGSPYAPPALTAALVGAAPEPVHQGAVPGAAVTDRAPPDLAELQLLRI
ncbi:hypothetical protein HYE82_13080 [Streptomyces sp. BR123]|uniref:DUF6153 family protein n=1 Tax=Streptomyces sp. BR123 TaxID=2749828 RepID=UPI0015C4C134|nr:DUF6153 family protein [Streptomyces sp. BR123]NXY95301.1 hypothetical protein [Streptomyces sp. BR123]